MSLSRMAIRDAKPREKQFTLFDGGGMYLLVKPDGNKYWRLDYRYGGKRRTLAIGVYPEVSLQQAQEKRTVRRRNLASFPNLTKADHFALFFVPEREPPALKTVA